MGNLFSCLYGGDTKDDNNDFVWGQIPRERYTESYRERSINVYDLYGNVDL